MSITNHEVQYGGFVKNTVTGEYECLFVTFGSELLAYNRAKEKAAESNEYADTYYDVNDIVVRQRTFEYTASDWK